LFFPLTHSNCGNLLPGNYNKACSTYFGGYYHGLYTSSDDESEAGFTLTKAMAFLRQSRGERFLDEHKTGDWFFPCEVIRLVADGMVVKQWIPDGSEQNFWDPEFKDTEINIMLEPEIMELVYVYKPYARRLADALGGCISRPLGIISPAGVGTWIKLPYVQPPFDA